MSKKRKSIMDGYFDEPNSPVEVNPFVEVAALTKKEDTHLNAPITSNGRDIGNEGDYEAKIKFSDLKTSSKKEFNSGTIPELKRNNSGTDSETYSGIIPEQLRNFNLNHKEQSKSSRQFRNNSGTDSETHSGIIPEQLRNNITVKHYQEIHFLKLSGNRKKILETVFFLCQKNGSLTTGPLSRDSFENLTGIDGEVIRVTCNRLVSEGYLQKTESKRGAGGFLVFEINHLVYSQILASSFHNNSGIIPEQFRNNSVTDNVTDNETSPSSKLVSNNINNNYLTISEQSKPIDKPTIPVAQVQTSWFKELDFSAVAPISPMQVNSSIRNLVQEKLQPEQVQDFLNRFNSWLKTQQKIQNPLAIFCDRLKEFATEGDSAILSAMTDQEKKMNQEYEAKLLSELQNEINQKQELQKAKLEINKIKATEEFEKWYTSASDTELAQMIPPSGIAPLRSNLHKMSARSAFMQGFGLEETTV